MKAPATRPFSERANEPHLLTFKSRHLPDSRPEWEERKRRVEEEVNGVRRDRPRPINLLLGAGRNAEGRAARRAASVRASRMAALRAGGVALVLVYLTYRAISVVSMTTADSFTSAQSTDEPNNPRSSRPRCQPNCRRRGHSAPCIGGQGAGRERCGRRRNVSGSGTPAERPSKRGQRRGNERGGRLRVRMRHATSKLNRGRPVCAGPRLLRGRPLLRSRPLPMWTSRPGCCATWHLGLDAMGRRSWERNPRPVPWGRPPREESSTTFRAATQLSKLDMVEMRHVVDEFQRGAIIRIAVTLNCSGGANFFQRLDDASADCGHFGSQARRTPRAQ